MIWRHRLELMNFNVQLDLLILKYDNEQLFLKFLNKLYEKRFYRRLHLRIGDSSLLTDVGWADLVSLHGLEKLDIIEPIQSKLPDLPNLKVLRFENERNLFDLKVIPMKFLNLRELFITSANDESILSFIRGLPQLKAMTILYGQDDANNVLKLSTLNTERQKVFNAQKVTIYVTSNTFLRTNWSIANGDTNLQMVEIKRILSHHYLKHYFL